MIDGRLPFVRRYMASCSLPQFITTACSTSRIERRGDMCAGRADGWAWPATACHTAAPANTIPPAAHATRLLLAHFCLPDAMSSSTVACGGDYRCGAPAVNHRLAAHPPPDAPTFVYGQLYVNAPVFQHAVIIIFQPHACVRVSIPVVDYCHFQPSYRYLVLYNTWTCRRR